MASDTFYCTKCKSNHRYNSEIGKEHYYKMNYDSWKVWESDQSFKNEIEEIDEWIEFYEGDDGELIDKMLDRQENLINKRKARQNALANSF